MAEVSRSESEEILEVGIAVNNPSHRAMFLSDIHFSLTKGECLAVIGPNGCGKSTLLNAISGIRQTRCGDIRLWGKPLHQWSCQT
ncbi:MAG: Hemin import ATP-binding protein HmuV [Candidatus Erwinia impunctatus]|nr:Hemin import ATP-binding protein HmuV [Culicoides impunctatus]